VAVMAGIWMEDSSGQDFKEEQQRVAVLVIEGNHSHGEDDG